MTPEQWQHIRDAYSSQLPIIMEASRQGVRSNPYFIDWLRLFTPIEHDAWVCIRCIGVPLYPQVPVLNYFIDFANPYKKIGLELDGKDFHDSEADFRRDMTLVKIGWKIFRIAGHEARRIAKTPSDFEECEEVDRDKLGDWLYSTADGVITALNEVYFRGNVNGMDGGYLRTLDIHRLVNFDLLGGSQS